MSQAFPLDAPADPLDRHRAILLQLFSLAWLSLECGVSGFAALTSHSAAVAAFGSDSLVELLSALIVLAQWVSGVRLSERKAARAAAVLLVGLAVVVVALAVEGLISRRGPEVSRSGLAITFAALLVMPSLAALKRREAHRTGNVALRADAAQSATCAYLALIALLGLGLNALFHKPGLDSAAALVAVRCSCGRRARPGAGPSAFAVKLSHDTSPSRNLEQNRSRLCPPSRNASILTSPPP